MKPHFQVNAKPVTKLKIPRGMKNMFPNKYIRLKARIIRMSSFNND